MNFSKLISDLRGIGLTQQQIAEGIGRKQPTVSDMARGKTTGKRIPYETAERLRKFHARKMRERRAA